MTQMLFFYPAVLKLYFTVSLQNQGTIPNWISYTDIWNSDMYNYTYIVIFTLYFKSILCSYVRKEFLMWK